MEDGPEDDITSYCWNVLLGEEYDTNCYVTNRGAYSLLARQQRLRFFREMADLYEHLAALHRLRVEAAAGWLDAHGHLQVEADPPLIPHGATWFAALERWSPARAMMTRRAILMAGRIDICSVCGDDPAIDYRLPERYCAAGGVDTLRLCTDCVRIRRGAGEPYEVISPTAVRDVT